MKLTRLNLKAVGPFTDRILDFHSETPGLHIIFGPNEAGKSSSLRALKALLYGFPQQTPDNFLHNYDQLLVGGCLQNSDGEELIFWRRKKRINDIIDEEGEPLPSTTLSQFLHGIEPEIFESLYGIDHEILVRGGEEILAQKGEVGQALFAAGAGISSLRKVIDQLEKEAAELFKPTGQLPEINKTIRRFKELQKEARAASLSCKDWKDHRKALKITEEERTKLEKERDKRDKEQRRLERLAQAIPELGSLHSYREQLQLLGDVTPLPPDFTESHRQVSQAIRDAELQLHKDSDQLQKLEEKRQTLSFNRDLIGQAEEIDNFHQRLGEYRKGLKDRPEREGMRISLRREAAQLLKQVRPDLTLDQLELLRSVLIRKKSVQRLSAEYGAIERQLQLATKQARTADQEHQEAVQALTRVSLPKNQDNQKLLQAVKLAQQVGNIDELLEKTSHELEQEKNACLAELKRLGHWSGDLPTLIELPLPLAETLQQFDKRYRDIANERRELEKEQKSSELELKKAQAEIKKEHYTGETPSEETLYQTRQKRDLGWQLLRRQWLDREDITKERLAYAPDRPLPAAYEGYVQQVDDIADRLRREADRVATAAALRAQLETQVEKLTQLDKAMTTLTLKEDDLDSNWITLWQPLDITPLSPTEMISWLTGIERIRYKTSDIIKKEQQIKLERLRRQTLRQAVQKELQRINVEDIPSSEKLGPLVALGEMVIETITSQLAEQQRFLERKAAAEKNILLAQETLSASQESLAQWQEQWEKAILGLGLTAEITPSEAIDLIDILQNCFDRVKDAADLKKRIDGIDRDAMELEKDVKTLLKKVAPDLLSLPLDQAILQIRSVLSQSQKESTLYDKLTEEYDSLQVEVTGAQKTLESAKAQMAKILKIAKSVDQEELAAAIRKFEEYKRLKEKISDSKANLAKIGAGVEIDEIIKQAAEINLEELPGQIESLKRDIAERIHPEINRISQLIGEQTSKLAEMDGSNKAAAITEQKEQELTKMRRLAERYAQVKLASKILQLEIERYREAHQDPVLIIGSRYFREMTLGSFTGLRTDVDDKGAPVLIGMRRGDVRVPVGGMSSGTRDQLYLALRLATLEYRLESHEPMPFIVDDILINFDDGRSRATLQALARLSARNQVILFTHHRQIVDDIQNIAEKNAAVVHTL